MRFISWLLASTLLAQSSPTFRVDVDLVVLSFTVKDAKGRPVTGLKATDVRLYEDGIAQTLKSFSPSLEMSSTAQPEIARSLYLLFDTSNAMYSGYAHAQDMIARFVRSVDSRDAIAMYSFSRNLSRMAPLTHDRYQTIAGLRDCVAGAGTALYDSILLTLRDAAKTPGQKTLIVFSNGPDTGSMLSPDDVRRVAEEEGIPIYVISTRATDEVTRAAVGRLARLTGGQAWFAATSGDQSDAFETIRNDLACSYIVSYRPEPNENQGFRRIRVEVNNPKYDVNARPGYAPKRIFARVR